MKYMHALPKGEALKAYYPPILAYNKAASVLRAQGIYVDEDAVCVILVLLFPNTSNEDS